MQYLARGKNGVGEFGGAGLSDERTNSGESSFDKWERKSGRHGAGPTDERTLEVVDMVRRR
jgi:hypothetical protein